MNIEDGNTLSKEEIDYQIRLRETASILEESGLVLPNPDVWDELLDKEELGREKPDATKTTIFESITVVTSLGDKGKIRQLHEVIGKQLKPEEARQLFQESEVFANRVGMTGDLKPV